MPSGSAEPAVAAGHGLTHRLPVRRHRSLIAHPLLHATERGPVQRGLAEEAHCCGLRGGALEGGGGIVEAVLGLGDGTGEDAPVIYGLRIVAYGFILLAIWQKNRPRR